MLAHKLDPFQKRAPEHSQKANTKTGLTQCGPRSSDQSSCYPKHPGQPRECSASHLNDP